MAAEFDGQDLRGAEFWDVDLAGARFRDVDLTGATISQARLVDVRIDALIDGLVINGVDVTSYVNEHDRWYPLRTMLRPADAAGMRAAWAALAASWAPTEERARLLGSPRVHESVDGEWSFVQTLRHLVFAMDKWFTVPVLGGVFHPLGLPNTGAADLHWPGLDRGADPSLDETLAVRAQRVDALRTFLDGVTASELARSVPVIEHGDVPVADCIHVVFDEEFHHHRYAVRDLDRLG